ncbi:VOC family protein [Cohnella boryungensis]|uniref:VOC family protein n=1 Tax=Cohnella boryungensis TaxID=768479 RepID=A0ABV8S7V5_9BACL
MPIYAYLTFNGNCREAVEFYAQVFGVEKPQIMAYGDGPPSPDHPLPEEAKDLVMHARLDINGSSLMFSDAYPGMPYVQGNSITLAYSGNDVEKLKTLFHKLQDGGKVVMDLQETFWSKCFGSLQDKFGIEWQINHDAEAPSA